MYHNNVSHKKIRTKIIFIIACFIKEKIKLKNIHITKKNHKVMKLYSIIRIVFLQEKISGPIVDPFANPWKPTIIS